MKRALTIVSRAAHQKTMGSAFKIKQSRKPDCAYCRNSGTEVECGKFVLRCRLGMLLDAAGCQNFRDSRDNLDANYLRIA